MNKANNTGMVRMMDVLGFPLEYFVDDSNQRLTLRKYRTAELFVLFLYGVPCLL
ncbi:hypothetical protein ACFVQB_23015 [Paenibacillus sp. NPDC057886]|uniref:hypothetical protein n=1 Tax=Paenibacillus sp. NPDC057886 TaxID=3346270 RepID=UPI0036C75169